MLKESSKPVVKPGDWIRIGTVIPPLHAVVCLVCEGHSANFGDIEVVYLDERDRATNQYAVWKDGQWKFAYDTGGGYADKYDRLRDYVRILREGRY